MSNHKKLFIGNIDWNVTDADLKALFEGLGMAVRKAEIVVNPISGDSRGFGYVHLDTAENAERACAQLNNTQWFGRRIRVDAADNKPRRTQ